MVRKMKIPKLPSHFQDAGYFDDLEPIENLRTYSGISNVYGPPGPVTINNLELQHTVFKGVRCHRQSFDMAFYPCFYDYRYLSPDGGVVRHAFRVGVGQDGPLIRKWKQERKSIRKTSIPCLITPSRLESGPSKAHSITPIRLGPIMDLSGPGN